MSLLEGHGDVTMDRAGADQIPSAERFGRVLRQRRQQANGLARLLQRLLGLEAKLAQYEQGEKFIAAVESVGGPAALDTVWEDPARLPTLAEIRDPAGWLARIDLAAGVGRRPWASGRSCSAAAPSPTRAPRSPVPSPAERTR